MDDRIKQFEESFSVLDRYGECVTDTEFVTNPAIGREEQIKQLILILLTPEKSAILIGKPGIGKTAIVEGLAYRMQKGDVPEALKGYSIINIKTASLLGTMPSGESKVQKMIDELKTREKVILFVDEIHMLIGATDSSSLDFANIFKEGLGRGSIKVIGATTTEEYERYILRDKAFTRRFQKVEVPEPSREETIKIMMGTLPKFEKQTGRIMKYSDFYKERIMAFLVDITSEYKRVFALGSRYPDVCLTLLKQAFSYTVFDDRKYMDIFDIRKAIENSKNIYPDVIRKELPDFDKQFEDIFLEEDGKKRVEEWRRDDTPRREEYVEVEEEKPLEVVETREEVYDDFQSEAFKLSDDFNKKIKDDISSEKMLDMILSDVSSKKVTEVNPLSLAKDFKASYDKESDYDVLNNSDVKSTLDKENLGADIESYRSSVPNNRIIFTDDDLLSDVGSYKYEPPKKEVTKSVPRRERPVIDKNKIEIDINKYLNFGKKLNLEDDSLIANRRKDGISEDKTIEEASTNNRATADVSLTDEEEKDFDDFFE